MTDRRNFLGSCLAAAPAMQASQAANQKKLDRLASNTWPVRMLFKSRQTGRPINPQTEALRKKYGEITLLDFPQFTIDTFKGVRHMDLFSGLFGDVTDDSMYAATQVTFGGGTRTMREFDPSLPAARAWLEKLASKCTSTGVHVHHISNNAPRDLCDPDAEKRKAGVAVAKKWLDAGKIIGAKSMRVNTGGPRIAPNAVATQDYPRNEEIVVLLRNAVESFKELAEYGGKTGVKITIENHWGLSANPIHIRIIVDEVKHPFCEASPDFCNWEHEYLLYHGLKALAPYTHTTVHAKYWNRWKEVDIARCVRIMEEAGFKGKYALEYEDGPWDGVEGSLYLMKEVLAAL